MEQIKNYKDLKVWQSAYSLALSVYRRTKEFPKEELYGLVGQARRSCVSVVPDIAEGYARKGTAEYLRFLSIAYASLAELETQLMLSKDLEYLKVTDFHGLSKKKDEAGGMLYKLKEKIRSFV
ncbi:MAG: four helix bundle protein [Candidatus Omnitrophica bacterium]|nr:four helix bundle protein [Candidatus Omnitrophota bacterium]